VDDDEFDLPDEFCDDLEDLRDDIQAHFTPERLAARLAQIKGSVHRREAMCRRCRPTRPRRLRE
jgi:hypothetical protein